MTIAGPTFAYLDRWRDPPSGDDDPGAGPCRYRDCARRPSILIESHDDGRDYEDVVCGRHLSAAVAEWMWRPGSSLTLSRLPA